MKFLDGFTVFVLTVALCVAVWIVMRQSKSVPVSVPVSKSVSKPESASVLKYAPEPVFVRSSPWWPGYPGHIGPYYSHLPVPLLVY